MACVAVVGWTSPQSLARPQRRTAALPWCFAGGSRRCSAFPRHTVRPLAQLLPLLRAPAAQNALDNVSNRVGVVAGTAQGAEASRLDPFRSAASRPVPRSWPPHRAPAGCRPCSLAAPRGTLCPQLTTCPCFRCLCSRRATRPQIYWTTAVKREEEEEQKPAGAAAAAAADAEGKEADAPQRPSRPDLDAIVDLSGLDLSILQRPARMPPLARVRRQGRAEWIQTLLARACIPPCSMPVRLWLGPTAALLPLRAPQRRSCWGPRGGPRRRCPVPGSCLWTTTGGSGAGREAAGAAERRRQVSV